MDSYLSFVGG